MQIKKTIAVKQGATISWPCLLTSCTNGEPVDLTGSTIKADVSFLGQRIASFAVEVLNPVSGYFNLNLSGVTLPVGVLQFDILRLMGGVVVYSETANLVVEPSITEV